MTSIRTNDTAKSIGRRACSRRRVVARIVVLAELVHAAAVRGTLMLHGDQRGGTAGVTGDIVDLR